MASLTDKITRLLAPSNSPYEAEAKAALLKGRQLMAKYKLTLTDVPPRAPAASVVISLMVTLKETIPVNYLEAATGTSYNTSIM